MVLPPCPPKQSQVDSKLKDMGSSTVFSVNIINLTCCTIIKMPASRIDNYSAGRTNCRSQVRSGHDQSSKIFKKVQLKLISCPVLLWGSEGSAPGVVYHPLIG